MSWLWDQPRSLFACSNYTLDLPLEHRLCIQRDLRSSISASSLTQKLFLEPLWWVVIHLCLSCLRLCGSWLQGASSLTQGNGWFLFLIWKYFHYGKFPAEKVERTVSCSHHPVSKNLHIGVGGPPSRLVGWVEFCGAGGASSGNGFSPVCLNGQAASV